MFETFSLADALRPAQAQRQQNLQAFSLGLQAKQLQQSAKSAAAKTKRDERKLQLDEQSAALAQAKHHLDVFEAVMEKTDEGNYEFLRPSIARMLDVEIDAMPDTAEGLVGEYQIAKSEYEQARAANEEAFGRFKSLGGGKYLERTDAGVEVKGGAAKWDDANIQLPSGEIVSGRVNKDTGQRQIQTAEGWDNAPDNARAIGLSVQASNISDLTKKTTNTLQDKLVSAVDGMSRLQQISQDYQRDFLTFEGKWQAFKSSVIEKYGRLIPGLPDDISAEDKSQLREFTRFQKRALRNVNDYIKSVTGAAMSNAEAGRIRGSIPDPGEGLFDGDSPTEFAEALENVFADLKMVAMRAQHHLNQGLGDPKKMSLDEFKSTVLSPRAQEIADDLRKQNPDITDDALKEFIRSQLSEEFGVPL